MRTTVTLDPDVLALIEAELRRRKTTFKQVVNDRLRIGYGEQAAPPREYTIVRDPGPPAVDQLDNTQGVLERFEDLPQP